jgi:hypothetical protein
MVQHLKRFTRRVALKTGLAVTGAVTTAGSLVSLLVAACSSDDEDGYGHGYGRYGYGLNEQPRIGPSVIRRA